MERKLKYSEGHHIKDLLNKVKLSEIMTENVISVQQDAPFHQVADKIQRHKIRHLPVVTKENKIIGLLTERDLYRIQSPRKLEDGTWYYDPEILDNFILKDVMIANPFTFRPDNTVAEAILKMVRNKYGCIPITDAAGKLCGIVTYVDLLKLAAQIIEEK